MPNDFRRQIAHSIAGVGTSVGYSKPRNVKLGKGDGTGTIVYSSSERLVHFFEGKLGGEIRSQGVALLPTGVGIPLRNNKNNEGLDIQLRYAPGEQYPEVFKLLKDAYIGSDGRSPEEQDRDRGLTPALAQLDAMRLRVVPNSNVVMVKGTYYYVRPSTGQWRTVTDPMLDLADDIDALTSGQHQLALVYFDAETGTLQRVLGSALTASVTPPNRPEFKPYSITNLAVPVYAIPSMAVYLYYAQALAEADLYRAYDPRQLFQPTTQRWAAISTSNATVTAALSIAVAEDSAITITGTVIGTKSDYSASFGGTFTATVRRSTGNDVALVGTPTITTTHDSGAGTPAISIAEDTGTQSLIIYVQGIAAEGWVWRISATEVKAA